MPNSMYPSLDGKGKRGGSGSDSSVLDNQSSGGARGRGWVSASGRSGSSGCVGGLRLGTTIFGRCDSGGDGSAVNNAVSCFSDASRNGGAVNDTIGSVFRAGRDSGAVDSAVRLIVRIAGSRFREIIDSSGFAHFLCKFERFCLGRWEERVRGGCIWSGLGLVDESELQQL